MSETTTASETELTVTQALARVGTLQARLEKKRETVRTYAARDSRLSDPIKEEGGAVAYVRQNMDAIRDLERNLVAVRTAIQKANFDSKLTVCGMTRTVQEWLNWRREILPDQKHFWEELLRTIDQERRRLAGRDEKADVIVHFPEDKARDELATLVEIEGTLDEQLSLYNATVKVRIPA